ncbi:MAG: TetR family transcriptional regulator [Bdellovibrionales bacterium]
MPRLSKSSLSESRLVEVALRVIARHGWSAVTLEEVAREAKVSVDFVQRTFSDKGDLLCAVARYVDGKSAGDDTTNPSASAHDRLFDALMARFDALQAHREAFVSMIEESRRDPQLLRTTVCLLRGSMGETLRRVGLDRHDAARQALITAALEGLYLLALRVWSRDESADMAKTMAALDRYLSRAEKVATALRIA